MAYEEILKCFPEHIKNEIHGVILNNEKLINTIEEIRIRLNLPIILKVLNTEIILNYIVKQEDIIYIMQKICENSLYSYQREISQGFITIKGGNRVRINWNSCY